MASTKDRPGSFEVFTRRKFELGANAIAVKGTRAAFATTGANAGYVVPMSATTGLIPIGRFAESVDNTGGAAGAMTAEVSLHRSVEAPRWNNDTTSPVTKAHRGSLCFGKDNDTVSHDGTGRSYGGFVWDVDATTNEVLVEDLPALTTALAPVGA